MSVVLYSLSSSLCLSDLGPYSLWEPKPIGPYTIYCTAAWGAYKVGWSDFHTFLPFSKTYTFNAVDQVYFRRSIPKNWQDWPRIRTQHAHHSLQKTSSYFKEHLPKRKFEIKIVLIMDNIVFDLNKGNINKEICLSYFLVFNNFLENVQILSGPATSSKVTLKVEF